MFYRVEKKLRTIGQEHLLNGFDTLSESTQNAYLNELNAIDMSEITQKINEGYITALNNDNEEISPFSGPSLDIVDLDYKQFLKNITTKDFQSNSLEVSLYNEGLNLISQNEVCVVLMAGGQGTRLDFNKPKGLFEIGVLSNETIFSLHVNSMKRLIRLAENKTKVNNIQIPLLVMTSSTTHDATKAYFREMNFFGLPEDSVTFFQQGVLPIIEYVDIDSTTRPETIITTPDGSQKSIKIIASAPGRIAYSPNGNGGIYSSLKSYSDIIKKCKFVHVIGVDNILVKIADPLMIGYISRNNLDIVNKVVIRERPDEKVGVMAVKSDRPCIVEYSELGIEKASRRKSDGTLMYNEANIASMIFSSAYFLKCMDLDIHWHIAPNKLVKIDPIMRPQGSAAKTIPSSELSSDNSIYSSDISSASKKLLVNSIKMEMFMFDILPFTTIDKVGTILGKKSSEFAPVKNHDKNYPVVTVNDCTPSSAKLLRSNYAITMLENAGVEVVSSLSRTSNPEMSNCIIDDNICEIVSGVTYNGEGLEKLVSVTLPVLIDEEYIMIHSNKS